MNPEAQFNALNAQIDSIEYSYPKDSPEREAVLSLNTLLFKVLSLPGRRATTALEIKDHLRNHKDNPELHRNLRQVVALFTDMVEAGIEAVKAEKAQEQQ